MVYDAWRENGGPTQHAPTPTAVTADVLEVGFIFAICILGFCFALVVPGYRGWSRFFFSIRVIISLFIASAILLGVLGQEWESAEIHTKTPYKAFTNREINASIGMKIGLGSVNITLKGDPVEQVVGHAGSNDVYEHIDYNERFNYYWRQGRFGFGPFAGRISREYRDAQFRGLPLPILWVAEYFTLDGELIRWGRSYRTAGWFSYQVLWTAFPLWLIANILSAVVLFYAGGMFILCGSFMLVSNVIWATIKWGYQPLEIPFEDAVLVTHYGPSFWLVVAGGITSFVYGVVIVCMDLWYPQQLADFFGTDILQDSEQYYHKTEQPEVEEPASRDIESTNPTSPHRGGVQHRINARSDAKSILHKASRRRPKPASRKYLGKQRSVLEDENPPVQVAFTNKGFEGSNFTELQRMGSSSGNGHGVHEDRDGIYENEEAPFNRELRVTLGPSVSPEEDIYEAAI